VHSVPAADDHWNGFRPETHTNSCKEFVWSHCSKREIFKSRSKRSGFPCVDAPLCRRALVCGILPRVSRRAPCDGYTLPWHPAAPRQECKQPTRWQPCRGRFRPWKRASKRRLTARCPRAHGPRRRTRLSCDSSAFMDPPGEPGNGALGTGHGVRRTAARGCRTTRHARCERLQDNSTLGHRTEGGVVARWTGRSRSACMPQRECKKEAQRVCNHVHSSACVRARYCLGLCRRRSRGESKGAGGGPEERLIGNGCVRGVGEQVGGNCVQSPGQKRKAMPRALA